MLINMVFREIYLFILGFFGFSILGQYVVFNVLHLPFFFVELYFIPLLYWKRKSIFSAVKKLRKTSFGMVMLYLLLIASSLFAIVNTSSVGVLLEYRSIIYLLFAFNFFKNANAELTVPTVLKLSIYAVLGELCYILVFSNSRIVSSNNCVAIALSIVCSFILDKYTLGMICVALGMFVGVISGFRIGIVVAAVSFAEMCIYMIVKRQSNLVMIVKRIVFLVTGTVVFLYIIKNFTSLVYLIAERTHMDSFAIFRVTERLTGFITGNVSLAQDSTRLDLMRNVYLRIWQIIPRGLIAQSLNEYSLYIDVAMIYLYDLFGSVAAWCAVFTMLSQFVKEFGNRSEIDEYSLKNVAIWMFPIMTVIFLINDSMIVIVFQAIETGSLLGILKNKNLYAITNSK